MPWRPTQVQWFVGGIALGRVIEESKHRWTHSAPGPESFYLLIHQKCSHIWIPLLVAEQIPFVFNEVQTERAGPQRDSLRWFSLKPVQGCHLFQSDKHRLIAVTRSSSGWSAGDTSQRSLAAGGWDSGLDYTPVTVAISLQWGTYFVLTGF